ncbi:glycosyltransferase [Fibrisoma montanum]|uniref:Glycosyltransferase n=1 Tax=Fibrisoma montanum TaxID=2305895 RepID=A0A418M878_9BACT|nr:glycosyltransferase [Fibrisoma montanum]RIV22291.1 glycosyltransferase [Fibrisoma montanum]
MKDEATVPLVSIVIPVYNQRLNFFREAVNSALQQTYPNVEVIVSNNHSTNEVPDYLDTLHDNRLRVVKPDSFLPMVQHFQFAADQAQGDWIMFLCSDDWIYPDCVETLISHLITAPESVVVAYGEIESVEHQDLQNVKFYYNRRKTGFRTAAESINELVHARPFIMWMPGDLFRRSAYQQVRAMLSGEFTYAFDLAMLFKLHEFGDLFYVNKPLGKFRFWTVKDGKVTNDRFADFIGDTGKLCRLIEQSPKLSTYLANGTTDMKAWRQYQAQRWLLGLLVGYISGDIDAEKCKIGINALSEHISSRTTFSALLAWTVSRPQSLVLRPALRGMHSFYSYLQSKVKIPF